MKIPQRIILTVLLLISGFVILTPDALARVVNSETIEIGAEEVIDDDLFLAGENITVNGTINGDLYAAGGIVTINGTINGDLLAAGGVINIAGTIRDDVRAAGGNIIVTTAQIGDNVSLIGGTVQIDRESRAGGSATLASGLLTADGAIGRNLLAAAGTVNLNGSVEREVRVAGDSIVIGPEANIGSDLTYDTENEPVIVEGAVIAGEVRRGEHSFSQAKREAQAAFGATNLGFKIFSFFAALLVGLLIVYILPKVSTEISRNLQDQLKSNLLWGILIFIITIPTSILLMISGIGIPLALMILAFYFIEIYLAKIFVAIVIGRYLSTNLSIKSANLYTYLFLGLVAYYILTSLPFIGSLIWIVSTIAGLGALTLYKKSLLKSH